MELVVVAFEALGAILHSKHWSEQKDAVKRALARIDLCWQNICAITMLERAMHTGHPNTPDAQVQAKLQIAKELERLRGDYQVLAPLAAAPGFENALQFAARLDYDLRVPEGFAGGQNAQNTRIEKRLEEMRARFHAIDVGICAYGDRAQADKTVADVLGHLERVSPELAGELRGLLRRVA
jgi:hypothetical protein